MKKQLTLEEWKVIGDKSKEVRKNLYELHNLLSGNLPKGEYLSLWKHAEERLGDLRSHLEDLVCRQFTELPNTEVCSIFYGKDGHE